MIQSDLFIPKRWRSLNHPRKVTKTCQEGDWHPGWRVYLQSIHISQFVGVQFTGATLGCPTSRHSYKPRSDHPGGPKSWTFVDFWKPRTVTFYPPVLYFVCWKILVAVGNRVIYLSSMYTYMYIYISCIHTYIYIIMFYHWNFSNTYVLYILYIIYYILYIIYYILYIIYYILYIIYYILYIIYYILYQYNVYIYV